MVSNMAKAERFYAYFPYIEVVSYINITFFFDHLCTWAFTKKIGRSYSVPRLLHFTDLIMVFCSIKVLYFV